jgi:hypothetical protein
MCFSSNLSESSPEVDRRVTETWFAAHGVTTDNFLYSLHHIYMVYFDFLSIIDSLTVADLLLVIDSITVPELLFFFDSITFSICRSSPIRSPLPVGCS